MIESLASVLLTATSGAPVVKAYAWAQIKNDQPHVHVGGGQWEPVTVTEGGWSYLRLNGQLRSEKAQLKGAPKALRVTVPIRWVALVERSACNIEADLLLSIVSSIRGATAAAKIATGAIQLEFQSISSGYDQVVQQELGQAPIPMDLALLHIDMNVVVVGDDACFTSCGERVDLLCALVDAATNAKLLECLGDRIDELCPEGGGPCDDGSVTIIDSEDTELYVVPVTSGGTATQEIGDTTIQVNSEAYGSFTAESSVNIPVVDTVGTPVATTVLGTPGVDLRVQVDGMPCEVCLTTMEIYVDGVLEETLTDLDPCEVQTYNISWT